MRRDSKIFRGGSARPRAVAECYTGSGARPTGPGGTAMKSCVSRWVNLLLVSCVLPAFASTVAAAEKGGKYFFYVSNKRLATLELALGKNKAIVNYINLGDVIELIEAPSLLILDADGHAYHGHLIVNENPEEGKALYRVSDLVKPREYRGYEILGDFRFASPPREAYLRLGGRIIRLDPLEKDDFEIEAAKVARIDLTADSKVALADAGYWRGLGEIYFPESPEAQQLEPKFPGAGPLPPVLFQSPPPRLPSKWSTLPDPVLVRLKAVVSAQGALSNLEVLEGVNPELDEQALETVRNSWLFLPAVSNGEPAGAELTLNVVFGH